MVEDWLEAWRVNQRINRILLNSIPEENLNANLGTNGRTVGRQFAHLHTARMMWLEVWKPNAVVDQLKFERGEDPPKKKIPRHFLQLLHRPRSAPPRTDYPSPQTFQLSATKRIALRNLGLGEDLKENLGVLASLREKEI